MRKLALTLLLIAGSAHAQLGIKTSNTGAQNSDAWDALLLTVSTASTGGRRIELPCGVYNFSRQVDVIRKIDLAGTAGGSYDPCVEFMFPAGVHGLYLHSYESYSGSGLDRSDGVRVSNIRVRASGKTTVKHGIVVRAPVILENIVVRDFAGDGVNTLASLDDPIAASASLAIFRNVLSSDNGVTRAVASVSMAGDDITVNTTGAHNLAAGDYVWFYRGQVETDTGPMERIVTSVTDSDTFVVTGWALYEGSPWTEWNPTQIKTGNGFFTAGGDANGITFDSCRAYTNEAWGDFDDSFLGNTHISELTDGNKIGAYFSIKATARTTWLGCYSELSNPQSNIAWPSVVWGGDQGAHIYGDYVGASSGLYNPMQIPTMSTSGTVGHKLFLGSIANSDPYLMRIRTSNGDDFYTRYDYGNAEFGGWDKLWSFHNYANVTGAAYALTGSQTVWANGRTVENGNIGKVAYTFGHYLNTGSYRGEASAVPSTGKWVRGDTVFHSSPAVNSPIGWVCTVSGDFAATPPTFVALHGPAGSDITIGTANTTAISYSGKSSGSLDFGSIVAGTCAELTQTLTGAGANDPLACGWPSALEANLAHSCRVSASDTITYRLCNVQTVTPIDPASGTYTARVIR